MRKKQYRELTERMDKNELLCHQIIGRLAALNERLSEVLDRVSSLDTEGTNNGAWMQDGIDSILGYQWPPKRGEGK